MNVTREDLITRPNEDLAGELGAIIQYLTYAAKASGPYRPQLVQFFGAEIADEQRHAEYLANKIMALGGEPITVPCALPRHPLPSAPPRRCAPVGSPRYSSADPLCVCRATVVTLRTRYLPGSCLRRV